MLAATAVVGSAGCLSSVRRIGGPPPTDTPIKTVRHNARYRASSFVSATFYESGAAAVTFERGTGFDRFAVTHNSLDVLDDEFRVWSTPTYEGPKVINLRRVLENNGPYPSNRFKFVLGKSRLRFSAPADWVELG